MIRFSMFLAVVALSLPACKKDKKADEAAAAKPDDSAAKSPAGAKTADTKTADTKTAEPPAPSTAKPFDATKIFDLPVATLDGKPSKVGDHKGKALMIVNVASKCGLTPQYATLEGLQKKYADKGFTVLGFPCNQFGGQEPGNPEEIAEFCSKTYGVTFPMFEKVEVNGDGRHPVYKVLTEIEDNDGKAGDVQWNFEKFVISADGKSIHRFRSRTKPNAPEVIAAINAGLPVAN